MDDQFFAEPIHYKEVEWIEIAEEYEDWLNENNRKAGKVTRNQNLRQIAEIIESIGEPKSKSSTVQFVSTVTAKSPGRKYGMTTRYCVRSSR